MLSDFQIACTIQERLITIAPITVLSSMLFSISSWYRRPFWSCRMRLCGMVLSLVVYFQLTMCHLLLLCLLHEVRWHVSVSGVSFTPLATPGWSSLHWTKPLHSRHVYLWFGCISVLNVHQPSTEQTHEQDRTSCNRCTVLCMSPLHHVDLPVPCVIWTHFLWGQNTL